MFHIRTTKTSSRATAVQVVRYEKRKLIVAAHLGSAHNKQELTILRKAALDWIEQRSGQEALFSVEKFDQMNKSDLISLLKLQFLGVTYSFVYECLTEIFDRFGFDGIKDKMLSDLALIRIIEPASKLRSVELLEELFGVKYVYRDFYRLATNFAKEKPTIEKMVIAIAKRELSFDFSLVFYDVTTLYFEAFGEDELRKPGFSKDGKSNQPQILIGLVVTKEGFPVTYEIFEGNKFEGKTIIPIILAFKKLHQIEQLTVVADAGMISADNVTNLKNNNLNYIVGARIANLPVATIQEISRQLQKKDGANLRMKTSLGSLVCSFSHIRYNKDKHEMEKQIKRAQNLINEPSKIKRAKFLKNSKKGQKTGLELNEALMQKATDLLGIKGYYTNLEKIDNQTIIEQYHNLWHVEHAFRIAKSDLRTRPIYHFKRETIEAHILICFMALSVCKYMELKTGKSTKKIIRELKRVTDAKILNLQTDKLITMRSTISEETKEIVDKLGLSY
jgi:transposase